MWKAFPKSYLYVAFCFSVFLVTPWLQNWMFLLLPLLVGLYLISKSDLVTGITVVMAYLSVEGAFKLFSQYNIVLRLATDFLILALFFRMVQFKMESHDRRKIFNAPFAVVFYLHLGWILIEFLNPYALGLLPSLAGYKVYVSSLLLYFIAYTAVEKKEDLHLIGGMAVILVIIQVVMSAYQFQVGEAGLIRWSPTYQNALGIRFVRTYFRPFGTSNVPGGGSTLIYLLTPLSLAYILKREFRWKSILAFLLLAAVSYVLFISQVRSALVKCFVGCGLLLAILMFKRVKSAFQTTIFLVLFMAVLLSFTKFEDPKFKMAEKRLMALNQFSKVWDSRSEGTGDSILRVIAEAPLGMGLSRVGAASEPFKDLIEADTKFGLMWSFADNLYKALLTEIGIPGFILFVSFLGLACLLALQGVFQKSQASTEVLFFQGAVVGAVAAAISGHLGSEGFLYQPESTVVWIFLGVLVKLAKTKSLTLSNA